MTRARSNPDELYPWAVPFLPRLREVMPVELTGAHVLGAGMNGIVFQPPGKKLVVKLTHDKSEVAWVREVLKLRTDGHALPGFVAFSYAGPRELGPFSVGAEQLTAYAYVRVSITPVPRGSPHELPLIETYPGYPRETLLQSASEVAQEWAEETGKRRHKLHDEYDAWIRRVAHVPGYGLIGNSLLTFSRLHGPLADAHSGNIGFAPNGTLVIYDCQVPFARPHALKRRPTRRANR